MKLSHIALNIESKEELVDFYQNILEFNLEYQFELNSDFATKFFGITKQADVFLYKNEDLQLELFINTANKNIGFSHICIEVLDREIIAEKSAKAGYPVLRIERTDRPDVLFVKDKSGNIFELKNK